MGVNNDAEIIRQIREVYHANYDFNSELTPLEQLEICESLGKVEEVKQKEDVGVNGNVNGTCKRRVNFILNSNKLGVIEEIKLCNYKTPIFVIVELLQELFEECETNPEHWAYIAENYSPRTINRVIHSMIKQYGINWEIMKNPAAFFTFLIKNRKKKKSKFK